MKILVINGANMNLLGKREPDIYGREDYAALCACIYAHAQSRGIAVECFQSNHEGAIIDAIQEADGMFDGIVINPGAYAHYSYAIRDAIKAARAGFEFADVSGALDKLDEETRELREAVERGTNFSEELGDVLFAAVTAGRFLSVDPEDALNATCEKFIARFRRVEEACAARGAEMSSLPLDELTRLWNEAKHPTE